MAAPKQRDTFEMWCDETGDVPGVFIVAEHMTAEELDAIRPDQKWWDVAKIMAPRILEWNLTYRDARIGTTDPVPAPSVYGWEAFLYLDQDFCFRLIQWMRRIFPVAPNVTTPGGLQAPPGKLQA